MYNTLEQLLLLAKVLAAATGCIFLALILISFIFIVLYLLIGIIWSVVEAIKEAIEERSDKHDRTGTSGD